MEFIIGVFIGLIGAMLLTFYSEVRIYIQDKLKGKNNIRRALDVYTEEYNNMYGVPPTDYEKEEFIKNIIMREHVNK